MKRVEFTSSGLATLQYHFRPNTIIVVSIQSFQEATLRNKHEIQLEGSVQFNTYVENHRVLMQKMFYSRSISQNFHFKTANTYNTFTTVKH